MLVKYHWLFLLLGLFISITFTGVSLVKQPYPNFLDPKRGFGARGEGTLTSQLIVMKNVNTELTKYNKYVLDLYEKIKRENRTDPNDKFKEFYENHTPENYVDYSGDEDNKNVNEDYDYESESESENGNNQNENKNRLSQNATHNQSSNISNNSSSNTLTNKDKEDEDFYLDEELSTKPANGNSKSSNRKIKRDVVNASLIDQSESEYGSLMHQIVYNDLTAQTLINLLPNNLIVNIDLNPNSNHALNTIKQCNYSLGLDQNLEFYFEASSLSDPLFSFKKSNVNFDHYNRNGTSFNKYFNDIDNEYSTLLDPEYSNSMDEQIKTSYLREKESNLLNLRKLKSLCQWDKKVFQIIQEFSNEKKMEDMCYYSLPYTISILNNKTDCMDLVADDVRNFINIASHCYSLHKTGILFAAAEASKPKPEIIKLIDKNNPIHQFLNLNKIKNNICFKNNILHIIYEYLMDKDFLSERKSIANTNTNETKASSRTYNVRIATLLIANSKDNVTGQRKFNEDFIYKLYLKKIDTKVFDDHETKITGINLIGIRQEVAMRLISKEMSLVALAIGLIVIATLLYLKSTFISMLVTVGVAMSVGVSYFAYRIVYDIELFPFLNLMAAFLLIGIACDNVYVLFDAWYSEKALIIMEDLPEIIEKQYNKENETVNDDVDDSSNKASVILPTMFVKKKIKKKAKSRSQDKASKTNNSAQNKINENEQFLLNEPPTNALANTNINNELIERGIDINDYELNPSYVRHAPLTDDQMVRVMSGTLKHAASSIFVTSFTTAAAFFTNYITKLPYVQLFGLFTGTCIIVYFLMVITMIAAFVVSYEKYIQAFRCIYAPNKSCGCLVKFEKVFNNFLEKLSLLNYRIVSQQLPKIIIKFRVIWFVLFLLLGLAGMFTVFYKPKLKPPANWRYQFFKHGNLFENFEFNLKDNMSAYINEEKRNLTNPEIFFLFGIYNHDTGRYFNPDDDGYLVYDRRFDFLAENAQVWLYEFINKTLASRRDLFLVDEVVKEWNTYLKQIQQLCYDTLQPKSLDEINIPYKREKLSKCQDEIKKIVSNSSLKDFEGLMGSFPRRIIFMSNNTDVTGILLRVNANRTFIDYDTVNDYYLELKKFHEESLVDAPDGFNTGWFISVGFALYDLQYQLITGTYSSLVASMAIALIILLLTSGNIIISVFSIITISFSIADTIAVFVLLGWDLNVLESVVIIMSVGLSVDFSCHYGVAYINSNRIFEKKREKTSKCKAIAHFIESYKHNNKERFLRINDIFTRVGSAVLMAAITTFLAGFSMFPSSLTSFSKMGQFLMLVMCTSYLFATFFFVPLCALMGPTGHFGNLRLKHWSVLVFSKCCNCFKKNLKSPVKQHENSIYKNCSTNDIPKADEFEENKKTSAI